jgi:hypothetical protein
LRFVLSPLIRRQPRWTTQSLVPSGSSVLFAAGTLLKNNAQ